MSTLTIALIAGCGDDIPPGPSGSGDAAAGGGQGAAAAGGSSGGSSSAGSGASAGAGGSGGACVIDDACGLYADRETCCGDPGCGWHHNNGHQLDGVPPCVAQDRVCMVAGRPVLECPDGTTCQGDGVYQDTANDCRLPPGGSISLLDRGICVCE
jgi:hypothetical protein